MKSLRVQCIELLTEIEARLDFDDEMPPLDTEKLISKIDAMWQDVQLALETACYDRLLQSGIQAINNIFLFIVYSFQINWKLYISMISYQLIDVESCFIIFIVVMSR